MAKAVYEGKNYVYWALTVASTAAPSVANITAAKNWTPFITKDGITVPSNQNMVDVAGINTVYDAQEVGSWGGGALELTMFRDDTTETDAYDAIIYGTRGFVIISRFGPAIVASKVEVWPAAMHEPALMQSAANEVQKFTASFAITAAPNKRAVVAA